MKRFALGFGLLTLLLLHLPTAAQAEKASSDASAIRATVTDYIQGY